jgi:hypothetical protein
LRTEYLKGRIRDLYESLLALAKFTHLVLRYFQEILDIGQPMSDLINSILSRRKGMELVEWQVMLCLQGGREYCSRGLSWRGRLDQR